MADRFGRLSLVDTYWVDLSVKSPTKKRRDSRKKGEKKAASELSGVRMRIQAAIRKIPHGKVSTYGAIARAAGLSGRARQVAQILHRGFDLPWQRVLGAGGEIKLRSDSAMEQRFRLQAEGVRFRGRRVDMKAHEFIFPILGRKRVRNQGD
jgi:methylated-DNA-protein-cysteine methyltransferase-like protein